MSRIEQARRALKVHKEKIRFSSLEDIGNTIRTFLKYDCNTGLLVWTAGKRSGKIAGNLDKSGYIKLTIDGRTIRAHRVAWYLFYNEDPNGYIDHINGNRSDNKITNLRICDFRANNTNDDRHRDGWLPGTKKHPNNKWEASIMIGKKRHYLGFYDTQEEAHRAYASVFKEE